MSTALPPKFSSMLDVLSSYCTPDEAESFEKLLKSLQSMLKPMLEIIGNYRELADLPSFEVMEGVINAVNSRKPPPTQIDQIPQVVLALFELVPKQIAPVEGPPPALTDLHATAASFDKSPFRNAKSIKFFVDYVSECVCDWASASKYYAPYLALLNASMTGKSRLLSEVSLEGVFAIITCFRSELFDSYRPPRTPGIADWATKSAEKNLLLFTSQCCTFFEACLKELLDFLTAQKVTKKQGKARMVELANEWKVFQKKMWPRVSKAISQSVVPEDVLISPQSEDQLPLDEIAIAHNLIFARNVALIGADAEVSVLRQIKDQLVKLTGFFDSDKVHVLFVFDEARKIVESGNFVALRRAMRILPDGKDSLNTFCVVTDTASSISNLATPSSREFSLRARRGGLNLYYPFVFVMGFDVWWNDSERIVVPLTVNKDEVLGAIKEQLIPSKTSAHSHGLGKPFRSCLSLEILKNLQVMSMFGRPALYPTLCLRREKTAQLRIEATISLLKEKLLCRSLEKFPKPEELSNTAYIAVLGAIASIEVSAASQLASELTAGHMRPVAGVSEDRHMVYSLEISEPFMALAAHQLIWDQKLPWKNILNAFRVSQLKSSTMTGFVGEVCAQMLLLMAWQIVLRPRLPPLNKRADAETAICFVPVLEYLKALLGETFENLLKVDKIGKRLVSDLAHAVLRAHQFVKTFEFASHAMLRAYFYRGSGIACRELQPATDLIIGMYFADNSEAVPIHEQRICAFQVQVKNHKEPLRPFEVVACFSKMKELHEKLNQKVADIFPVSLLIELHRETPPPRSKKQHVSGPEVTLSLDKNIYEIHVRGLSPGDILREDAEATTEAFRRVLKSVIDPRCCETIPEKFRDTVTDMFPTQPYMVPIKPPQFRK